MKMNKLYWNQVEYNKIKLYYTCTRNGITFINNPNAGISNIYNFYPDLDAEFCFDKQVTSPYKDEIKEFLEGDRKGFTIKADMTNQKYDAVYQAIREIKYGSTITFKQFCQQHPFDDAEVKEAILNNPLIMIIPTHRILGVDYSNSYRKLADFNQLLLNIEQG